MRPDAALRTELAADFAAVRTVVESAFDSVKHADLVDALRRPPMHVPELCVVAERDDVVVGYVMIGYATLVDGRASRQVASLSPLAVVPSAQRQGIGSALVREVTSRAERLGEPAVVLEGDPAYYMRFGFEPATAYGIELPLPSWAPPEAAQILWLAAHTDSLRGRVEYPPAFDIVAED